METSTVERNQLLKTRSSISIMPYINPDVENMGLEKYGMVLFEGAIHEEPLAFVEQNGIRRYLTGLNEFAPEVQNLEEPQREAVIKDIRKTVVKLEKFFASNVIDEKDENFWDKVKVIRNDNEAFWSKIILRTGNSPVYLDPVNDMHDLIKVRAIEAGGFSGIAKSYEEARKSNTVKFYLDRFEETASIKTEVKKMRNKALAELEKLYNKNINKLFLVTKCVSDDSTLYKKTTPSDTLYDVMDKYINGETVEKDKKKTAQRFLDIASLDMETLKVRAMVKDAYYHKIINTRPDGHIYHIKSSTMLGKNVSDVIEYLKNPLSEDMLKEITVTIEKFWNS